MLSLVVLKYLKKKIATLYLKYFISIKMINLKKVRFSFDIIAKSNDLRLLTREFFLFTFKFAFIKNFFFFNRKQYLDVLRSPFVYNKSYEQFQIETYYLKIKSLILSNLIFEKYYDL